MHTFSHVQNTILYACMTFKYTTISHKGCCLLTPKMTLTEYMPQSGGVVDSCTAPPTSSCSLTIPYNSDYWVLVETSPPSDGQWDANVNAGTSYNACVWVYVVMVFAPLIGIILIVATTIGVCCCVKKMSGHQPRSNDYQSLLQQTTPPAPSAPRSGFQAIVLLRI